MRISVLTALSAAVIGTALAGCADGTTTASPSSTPSAGASTATATATAAQPGPVDPCLVGTWRSTEVKAQAGGAIASAGINGGGGVAVAISTAGQASIDFAAMQPVQFAVTVAGAQAKGSFVYAGQASAALRLTAGTPAASAVPSASAAPSAPAAVAGAWEPIPPITWGDTRVTVDLTQPVKGRPIDNVKIADYVGDGANATGNVVDVNPLLGKAAYACTPTTLTLTPTDANGLTWVLSKA